MAKDQCYAYPGHLPRTGDLICPKAYPGKGSGRAVSSEKLLPRRGQGKELERELESAVNKQQLNIMSARALPRESADQQSVP